MMPSSYIAQPRESTYGTVTYFLWQLPEAGEERLRQLRSQVRIKLIELDELFELHPDPLSRTLAMMRRIAPILLGDEEAEPVREWVKKLESGDTQEVKS
jgi:hypothetical protein